MAEALHVDDALIERMAVSGPRYTSYPTAPEWSDDFGPDDAWAAIDRAAARADEPLTLYVHLPFCERLCLYCGCTVEIRGKKSFADTYLDAVEREIALVSERLGGRRTLAQMHWGGGTPTFLSCAQLERLHGMLSSAFTFAPDAERSLEVDPHVTTPEQVDLLFDLGFNRVSMGVQDLDPAVQAAVRRDQTEDDTARLIAQCRARGADGINVDLMYGLPGQTEAGFAGTLERVAAWKPDRLAVFGYAHVPWMKPAQKALEKLDMPSPALRARLFGLALEALGAAGHEVIGLDHFALPTDSLAQALHAGTLHRNFMGYATAPAEDMVAFGMSAIGELGGAFLQNARTTAEYQAALSAGRLATIRGLNRDAEDELRRAAILSIMCRMHLDLDELGARFGRDDLAQHFTTEWTELAPFTELGLCTLTDRRLDVTPTGRLFLRHMAMPFDAYLRKRRTDGAPDAPRFSKTL